MIFVKGEGTLGDQDTEIEIELVVANTNFKWDLTDLFTLMFILQFPYTYLGST